MDEILKQAIDERRGSFFQMTEDQTKAFFEAYLARRDNRLAELIGNTQSPRELRE